MHFRSLQGNQAIKAQEHESVSGLTPQCIINSNSPQPNQLCLDSKKIFRTTNHYQEGQYHPPQEYFLDISHVHLRIPPRETAVLPLLGPPRKIQFLERGYLIPMPFQQTRTEFSKSKWSLQEQLPTTGEPFYLPTMSAVSIVSSYL